MTDAAVLHIAAQSLLIAAKLAAPFLLTTMGVGVGVGLVQSVTQLQEPTLTFVPKFVAVGLVIVLGGSWMLQELIEFTHQLVAQVPQLIR